MSPLAVGVASGLGLLVELMYTRLTSVMFWGIFGYLVISVALLGFGLPGVVLAVARAQFVPWLSNRLHWVWAAFAATSLLPYGLLMLHEPTRPFKLLFAASMSIPFACAGMIGVLAFAAGGNVRKVAAGSTLGGLAGTAIAAVLPAVIGVQLMLFLASAGALVAAVFWASSRSARIGAGGCAVAVCALGWLARDTIPQAEPEKWYPMFSRQPNFHREVTEWDPVARIDVTDFDAAFISSDGPVPFKLLTQDFTAPSFFLHFPTEASKRFVDRRIESVGYWARPAPEAALIIGLGGGPDVQAAMYYGTKSVDAVEINGTTLSLLTGKYDEWSGGLGHDPRIRWIHDDGGHFLRTAPRRYDHIQMSGVDTDVASVAGTSRIAENYLYTVELVQAAYDHLNPDGLFVFAWADFSSFLPVKERMFLTVLQALHRAGVSDPEKHVVVVGAGGTFSILVKHGPFTVEELARIRDGMATPFAEGAFEMLYRLNPDMPKVTPTRAELMYSPDLPPNGSFFSSAVAQLQPGQGSSLRSNWFNIEPTTNDRPFFFVMDSIGGSMVTFQRYFAVVEVSGALGIAMLLVPLFARKRKALQGSDGWPVAALWLFGWGFASVEVVFLQEAVYLVGHPALAVAVVIGALLGSMTAGNLLSSRLQAPPMRVLSIACGVVALALVAFPTLHRLIVTLVDTAPLGVRVACAALVVSVPGIAMGVPFPAALQVVSQQRPHVVVWALAANASANAVATTSTVVMCWFLGFQQTLGVGALAYLGGTLLLLRFSRAPSPAGSATLAPAA